MSSWDIHKRRIKSLSKIKREVQMVENKLEPGEVTSKKEAIPQKVKEFYTKLCKKPEVNNIAMEKLFIVSALELSRASIRKEKL